MKGIYLFALGLMTGVTAPAAGARAEELAGGEAPFQVVEVSDELCRQLAIYVPNGEADYRPGIAANGRPVVPADVAGSAHIVPRGFYSFPVRIAPLGRNRKYSGDSTIEVATVTFDPRTGLVMIDGQEVGGADRALADACAHRPQKSGGGSRD